MNKSPRIYYCGLIVQNICRLINRYIMSRINILFAAVVALLSVACQQTSYNVKSPDAWAMGHVIDCEGFYSKRLIDTMNQSVYTMPLLIQTPSKKWILLHESDVMGKYCASYLH